MKRCRVAASQSKRWSFSISSSHEGDEYRFHLTVEMGKMGVANPFKADDETLPRKLVDLSLRAAHLAMFFYVERPIQTGSFILYRVMPLGQQTE